MTCQYGGAAEHTENLNKGCLHVLSNITDTSYLIGDGQVVVFAAAKYFVFESDEYDATLCLTILNMHHHQY